MSEVFLALLLLRQTFIFLLQSYLIYILLPLPTANFLPNIIYCYNLSLTVFPLLF
jgi:hypothetical protein